MRRAGRPRRGHSGRFRLPFLGKNRVLGYLERFRRNIEGIHFLVSSVSTSMQKAVRIHLLLSLLFVTAATAPLSAHDDDPKRVGRVAPTQGPIWRRNVVANIQGGGSGGSGGMENALGFAAASCCSADS